MVGPHELYACLLTAYGRQRWWPAESALAMMAGALLVQNTAWIGAARAVDQLVAADCLSPAAWRDLPDARLWELLRPAGFFRVKTERLRALARFLQTYDDDPLRLFQLETTALRTALLGVRGIGQETADSMVCYGAGRPLFVVDAYTRRLFSRLGWVTATAGYEPMQVQVHEVFASVSTADERADSLAEFHALIVRHAKNHCRSKPLCVECPVWFCPRREPLQGA